MNHKLKACVLRQALLLGLLLASILPLAPTAGSAQDGRSMEAATSGHIIDVLTEEEHAWLQAHPVITVAHDPDWAPVEFSDERGELTGMSGDYLKLVEQRLGLKFKRIPNLSWQEVYARQKRWEIDMATCVAATPQRTEFWAFTKPYLRIPIVIATQSDVTYIGDMKELFGKKVALVKGYAIDDWVTRDFPEINLARVNTVHEGLAALQRGDVFAYIDNLLIIGDYQAKMKVANIKIAGQTPYVNAQCMAVRKDWAPLAGIIQKALDSISETERNDIYRKWLPVRYEQGFNYTLFWQALGVFAVIFLGLMLWNRKLSREIANRKRAEETRAELSRLIEESLNEIYVFDSDTLRFVLVNNGARNNLGYTMDELHSMTPLDLKPDSNVQTFAELIRPLRTGAKPKIIFETKHRRKNNSLYDVEVHLQMATFKGRPVFLAIIIDISARNLAEEANRQANLVIENSPVVLFRWKAAEGWPVVMVSRNVIQFGYTPEDLLSGAVPFAAMVHPEDLDRVGREVQEYSASGKDRFQQEYRIVTKDGGVRYVDDRTVVERNAAGQILYYQGIVIDITERKRAEEALRESEEQFTVFMENLPAGAFMKHELGQVVFANRYLCNLFGWDNIIGRPTSELLPPEVAEKMVADDRAALAQGPITVTEQVRDVANRERFFKTCKFPIARKNRTPLMGGISIDITELKQAEEALRSSIAEKEFLIKEVHHRVKNNLQVISSLLSLQFRQVKNADFRSFLQDTQNRIRSMALLHEILYRSDNFAKIGFPQYVKSVCSHLARSYGSDARNIRLKLEIADVTLSLDQAITTGLIVNELVANAFKHAFPSRSSGEILVELQATGERHHVLRVSDNGVGFPAETNPESTESLGLLLVRNLSRQMDGQITVTSEQGAVFQIVFPTHSV